MLRAALAAVLLAPALAADTPAPSASAASGPAAAAAPAALQLRYTTVTLPTATEGQAYGPRLLLSGGRGPYSLRIVSGALPPGLAMDAEGWLSGTPTATAARRSYGFTLEASDAGKPPQVQRQAYAIYVAPPRKAAAPKPAASAPLPPPSFERDGQELRKLSREIDEIVIYQLTEEKLAKVLKDWAAAHAEAAAPAAPAPAASAPADDEAGLEELPFSTEDLQAGLKLLGLPIGRLPTQAQDGSAVQAEVGGITVGELERMLKPLLDTEFLTRALFESALREARCSIWREWLRKESAQDKRLAGLDCRRVGRAPPPPLPPAGRWSPRSLHDALLPESLLQALVAEAERPIRLSEAKGLQWRAADCGCVRPLPEDEIVALMPFWQADEKAEPVDFSAFKRINLLGAALQDSGALRFPRHWERDIAGFAHRAQRHDVRMDLVVYRRDWASLLSLPVADQRQLVQGLTRSLAAELNRQAKRPWPRPMLPAWREPDHVFDGITLWFEDSPREPAQAAAFHALYRHIVDALVQLLRQQPRPLTLHLVVPKELMGQPGAYQFDDLIAYVERRPSGSAPPAPSAPISLGSPDVRLLVLLGEPTTQTKKEMRAAIDYTQLVVGRRRVYLLNHVSPLAMINRHPPKGALALGEQYDDDLAYYQWVFGGVALWPMPRASGGHDAQVLERVSFNYPDQAHWTRHVGRACSWICPNREGVRLLLEIGLIGCAVSLGLLLFTDLAQNRGRWMRLLLLVPLLLVALISFGLLSCDPQWAQVRDGNAPLLLLAGLVLAALLGLALSRRVPPP